MVISSQCLKLSRIRCGDKRGLLRCGISEVAARRHIDGRIGVDGPADHHVEDVAGNDPADNEDTKGIVASVGVAHVLEKLGSLQSLAIHDCAVDE